MTPVLAMDDIKAGIYQHFKGGRYEVLGSARHSETGEKLVVYRPLYRNRKREAGSDDESGLWVRPLAMFTEEVERDGEVRPRFRYVEPAR